MPEMESVTRVSSESNDFCSRKAVAAASLTTIFFCLILAIWLRIDMHIPVSDEANHVMNGLTYAELLQHARLTKEIWWKSFFTVNTYYPPVGTLTMGVALAIFKNSTLALTIVKLIWLAILSYSVGLLAFAISESVAAVVLSICLVNSCIIICDFSHCSLIDQPLVSMIAAGLAALLWKRGKASLSKSLITGTILGLAIMTKQVAVAFLGFPILLEIIATFRQNSCITGLKSTFALLLPLILICFPWTIMNFSSMQQLNADIATELAKQGTQYERTVFNIRYYLESWLYCASPLILFTSLLGATKLKKIHHKKLTILWMAMIPAAVALCLISCQPARDRYLAPIVILISLLGGCGFAQLRRDNRSLFNISLFTLTPLCAAQFVSFNFCPYPKIETNFLETLAPLLRCTLREHVAPFFDREKSIVYASHLPPDHEGGRLATKILDRIAEHDGNLESWFNITAITGGLDVHEMELLAKLQKRAIKPTTSRQWTALGDKQTFSEADARHYRWYAIKEGPQGFRFADDESAANHQKLVIFVKAQYQEVETFQGLDGTKISLYCQNK
jgi:hypothetical protein